MALYIKLYTPVGLCTPNGRVFFSRFALKMGMNLRGQF